MADRRGSSEQSRRIAQAFGRENSRVVSSHAEAAKELGVEARRFTTLAVG